MTPSSKKPLRKPPKRVLTIHGKPLEDRLTQEYYRVLAKKQSDIHRQYAELVHELIMVGERLKAGAEEEPGDFYFDAESTLVRKCPKKRSGGRKLG